MIDAYLIDQKVGALSVCAEKPGETLWDLEKIVFNEDSFSKVLISPRIRQGRMWWSGLIVKDDETIVRS